MCVYGYSVETSHELGRACGCVEKELSHLHQNDGVEDHKRFRQGTGDVGILVEAKHPGPRGHGHGLDFLHVAAVRVFVVVGDTGVDSVLIEGVVRVENLIFMQTASVKTHLSRELFATCLAPVVQLLQSLKLATRYVCNWGRYLSI